MISAFGIKFITKPSVLTRALLLGTSQLSCQMHTTSATYRRTGTEMVVYNCFCIYVTVFIASSVSLEKSVNSPGSYRTLKHTCNTL